MLPSIGSGSECPRSLGNSSPRPSWRVHSEIPSRQVGSFPYPSAKDQPVLLGGAGGNVKRQTGLVGLGGGGGLVEGGNGPVFHCQL